MSALLQMIGVSTTLGVAIITALLPGSVLASDTDLFNVSISPSSPTSGQKPVVSGQISARVRGVMVTFDNLGSTADFAVSVSSLGFDSFTTANDPYSPIAGGSAVELLPVGVYKVAVEASDQDLNQLSLITISEFYRLGPPADNSNESNLMVQNQIASVSTPILSQGQNPKNNEDVKGIITVDVQAGAKQVAIGNSNFPDFQVLSLSTAGAVSVNLGRVAAPPAGNDPDLIIVGGVYDFTVSETQAVVFPVSLRIYYTKAYLKAAGVSGAEIDGLYYYDWAGRAYRRYSQSGVDRSQATIAGVDYEGYVWAEVDHLTAMTAMARKANKATLVASQSQVAPRSEVKPSNPVVIELEADKPIVAMSTGEVEARSNPSEPVTIVATTTESELEILKDLGGDVRSENFAKANSNSKKRWIISVFMVAIICGGVVGSRKGLWSLGKKLE